jgi:hypothetical protein
MGENGRRPEVHDREVDVGGLRYFGGAVAFGFAAVWILASLAAALVCVLSAALGYGGVVLAERMWARLAARSPRSGLRKHGRGPVQTPVIDGVRGWAEALNTDLGHVFQPGAAMSPLAREAEYGWPLVEEAGITSEPLH